MLVLSLLVFLLRGSFGTDFGPISYDFGSEFEANSARFRVILDWFLVASGWLLLLLLLVLLKPGLARRALKRSYFTTFRAPLKAARLKMAYAWGVAGRCS